MKCRACGNSDHITHDHVCVVCNKKDSYSHLFIGCPDCNMCDDNNLHNDDKIGCDSCGISDERVCSICQKFHPTKEHRCIVCQKTGIDSHNQKDCPERCGICSARFHRTNEHKCERCGEICSHTSKNCPKRCTTKNHDIFKSIPNAVANYVCRTNMDLEHLKVLCRAQHWTPQFVRADDNSALRVSVSMGTIEILEIVKWLITEFDLTREDAQSENWQVFTTCMAHGYLDIAKWLAQRFKLTTEDARSGQNAALRFGIEKGQLECVKWLTTTFGLTADDAQTGWPSEQCALKIGISEDRFECTAWLIWRFGLDTEFEELEIDDNSRKEVEKELEKLRPRLVKAAR